jgi:hypothetical protein
VAEKDHLCQYQQPNIFSQIGKRIIFQSAIQLHMLVGNRWFSQEKTIDES